jgi:DNA-binding MarR family transcriptional regulator
MRNGVRAVAHRSDAIPFVRQLAWFRYQLRMFLHFSERAARLVGITPQQHQLILGVAGYNGRGWATISELAEFLQQRHNAVVGLVERAARRGLVYKEHSPRDRRFVRVRLTPEGEELLAKLSHLHRDELLRVKARLVSAARSRPRILQGSKGA